MLFIFLAVFFSVAVSLLLKFSKARPEISINQLITFNYLSTIILCYVLLKPNLDLATSISTIFLLITLGILLPSLFIIMAYSIQYNGMIKTEIAQRLSLFIPILAALTFFQEQITAAKIIGIILAFTSILLLINQKQNIQTNIAPKSTAIKLLMTVFLGLGLVDILFKQLAKTGNQSSNGLFFIFLLAFIIMIAYLLLKKEKLYLINIILGLFLGCLNFANIYFYIVAHQYYAENPVLVFTAMNIGVIVLGTLFGKITFKEPINIKNWLGIGLAILSIIIIFYGSQWI